jgi:aspartyl-tRNA(Asn)/glutamyl-tRNA(Gln) amidotransferase subunit A
MYLSDIHTVSVNLAGLPGLSLPCGFSKAGLPIGLQLIGKAFHESELLSVAHQFERAHDFAQRFPIVT